MKTLRGKRAILCHRCVAVPNAKVKVQFFVCFVCFSNPTFSPRSPIGSVPCVPSNTLSSPAFKGVTRGMRFLNNR